MIELTSVEEGRDWRWRARGFREREEVTRIQAMAYRKVPKRGTKLNPGGKKLQDTHAKIGLSGVSMMHFLLDVVEEMYIGTYSILTVNLL